MKFLIDTNVVAEATRPDPSSHVLAWLRKNEPELALDPVVLGEIRLRVLLLPEGKRRCALDSWFVHHVQTMVCLPWDATSALHWATLLAKLRSEGNTMPLKDSMIAATALSHKLTVATRNVRDFRCAGVPVVDPFQKC